MREVILPFWVNASIKDFESMDHKFYAETLPERLILKGVVLQGPFMISSQGDFEVGYKDFPAKMLSFETGPNNEKICLYEQGLHAKEFMCNGVVTVSQGKITIPTSFGMVTLRKLDRSDLRSLDVDNSSKKTMRALLDAMKKAELDEDALED